MLDLKQIREDFAGAASRLRRRSQDAAASLEPLRALDDRRRKLQVQVDALKNQRNVVSKEVGQLKAKGMDTSEKTAAMRTVGDQIAALDIELRKLEDELEQAALLVPNLPDPGTPDGNTASANREVRRHGEPLKFSFPPKPHWDLGPALGILDFEGATRVSGSGFACLRGAGARLQRGLINLMLDLHTQKHGYQEVWPPYLVLEKAMIGTGQLPKFREEMYALRDDPLYLAPTAEVPLTNLYRDRIFKEDELPIRVCASTPCFRREAGAAGKETRGMIRVHQFDKVELVKIVKPGSSYDELEKLVADAEAVLQALELHYRVVLLCAGDLGFAAARCYDIEVWCPGVGGYLEVSSCSNFESFQARRMSLRYKDSTGKNQFCHTLNGSGTALPRLVIALLETHQQPDGSVRIPGALRPYVDGMDRIAKPTIHMT